MRSGMNVIGKILDDVGEIWIGMDEVTVNAESPFVKPRETTSEVSQKGLTISERTTASVTVGFVCPLDGFSAAHDHDARNGAILSILFILRHLGRSVL
jgi:hypothetical protein